MPPKQVLGVDPFARTSDTAPIAKARTTTAAKKGKPKSKATAAPKKVVASTPKASKPKPKRQTSTKAKSTATPAKPASKVDTAAIKDNLAKQTQQALRENLDVFARSSQVAQGQSKRTMQTELASVQAQLDALSQQLSAIPLTEHSDEERAEMMQWMQRLRQWFDPQRSVDFWYEFVLASRSENIDPFGLDPKFEARVEKLLEFMYRRWWRVEVEGVDNIPDEGRALIVANHSGVLPYDGAMIKMAVRLEHQRQRRVRFLVENFVFYFPFLGTFMYRFGSVRASQANARKLLEADDLVAVFPEGVKGLGKPYRLRYQLQRFGRGGFIRLAAGTDSPIVPTAVIGAEEIMPMVGRSRIAAKALNVPYVPITPTFPSMGLLGLLPYPTKWRIRFAPAVSVGQAPSEGEELWVHEQSLAIRRRIQEQLYLGLQARKSIFFG